MSKQGRGALIGAGIGLVAGFVVGRQTFDDQDGEPNGKLIAISSVLGGLLGMAIGASVSH
ncbi:MAG: glycine zipper domain-containing protein [Gemmatimonadota bacterium]